MRPLKTFLESNPTAEHIRLESLVVLHRTHLSPKDILSLGEIGSYTLSANPEEKIELQIGESVVAEGDIVEEAGEYYLEVSKVFHDSVEKKEQQK